MRGKREISNYLKKFSRNYFRKTLFPFCTMDKKMISEYYHILTLIKTQKAIKHIKKPKHAWLLRQYAVEGVFILVSIIWVILIITLFPVFKGMGIFLATTIITFQWILRYLAKRVYYKIKYFLIDVTEQM